MSQQKTQQLAELGAALNTSAESRTEKQRHLIVNASPVDLRRATNLLNANAGPEDEDNGEPEPIAAESFKTATLRDRVAAGHAPQAELDALTQPAPKAETLADIDQQAAFAADRKQAGHL